MMLTSDNVKESRGKIQQEEGQKGARIVGTIEARVDRSSNKENEVDSRGDRRTRVGGSIGGTGNKEYAMVASTGIINWRQSQQ